MKTLTPIIAAVVLTVFGLVGAVPAAAKDWSKIRIGVEGAFPPWNLTDANGKLAGFDIDLINNLCDRAKVNCELFAQEWSGMIPSLNAGKFDAALSIGINEARKKVIDFSVPYASGAATFAIAKKGSIPALPMTGERLDLNDKVKAEPVVAEIDKLIKGKTVGVVASTSHEQLINTFFGKDVSVRTYKTSQERDFDLLAGRIDVGFDSAIYTMYIKDKPGNEELAASGPLIKGAMLATEVAIGLRKDEPELKAIFDKAIKEALADGTIRTLSVKWMKFDLSPAAAN